MSMGLLGMKIQTMVFLKKVILDNLNFHPLEVVSRYRDPQLQVGENYLI